MSKLIVANWKMLPETLAEAEELLTQTCAHLSTLPSGSVDLVVCPQFAYLERVVELLVGVEDVAGGAQDVPESAVDGVRYVIIGHSDRRWGAGESDAVTNSKLKAVLHAGITPIVCLGERTRQDGWQQELAAQTRATLAGLSADDVAQCLIAYEPVWAISTNPDAKPDTPASAVQSMSLIRETIADTNDASHATYVYGGSVTPANAQEFLERPEIGGVLVGGASVRIDDFCRILSVAAALP